MMRPFTLICMGSAFAAGLYLYQSKHAAQELDKQIGRKIRETEQTRERTGMLKAEWALLNEPDRLADLARAHLSLQTLKPTQFAAMADLPSRLPAPVVGRPEPLPAEPVEDIPVAQAPSPAAPAVAAVAAVAAKPEPKVASAPEKEKPKPEPKVAEAKPAPKPVVERVARFEPVHEPVREAMHEPVRPREILPPAGNPDATAPGTVGAAVLRAMRAQNAGYAPPPPVRYATPAYEPPAPARATYVPPAQTAYLQPPVAYAPAAPSVLGGRSALPPPVPFAAR